MADVWETRRALELGARGFLPKTLSGKELVDAVDKLLTGGMYMPEHYTPPPLHLPMQATLSIPLEGDTAERLHLTRREQQVLGFLLKGISNKEIARALELEEVTVKLHVRGVCRKLAVKNRTQAALRARELGLAP